MNIKQIKTVMRGILDKERVWGYMDLIYKSAKVLNIKTIPYNTFIMWKGIANKLLYRHALNKKL